MENLQNWLVPVLIFGGSGIIITILVKMLPREKIYNAGRAVSRIVGLKIGKGNMETIEEKIIDPFIEGLKSDNEGKK